MGCESRIYLSKSNLADKQHLHKVRVYLMELGYDVVEWESSDGPYTEHPMLECEQMVMVGYDLNDDDIMEVGKGQYRQLEFRQNNGFHDNLNCYFVGLNSSGEPEFYSVETVEVINSNNWKQGYGQIQLIDEHFLDDAPSDEKEKERARPVPIENEVDLSDPRSRAKHLACITLLK